MALSSLWLNHGEKFFKGMALLSIIVMIPILGDLTGIFKNEWLLNIFLSVDPRFPMHHLTSNYFQVLILNIWFLAFFIINLKFFTGSRGFESIRFSKVSAFALFLFFMFFLIRPRPYSINIEWLTQKPVRNFFYSEDGFFENMTAIFLFIAFVAFFLSAKISNKKNLGWKIISFQFLLGAFCLLFLLEEISWGQRIFGWGTPDWMNKINSQHETNIHNICNKLFNTEYCAQFSQMIFNICFSLALLFLAGLSNHIHQPSLQGIFRLDKYYFLAIIMAVATVLPCELNEEILALFFLTYSYDVLKFYRNFQPPQKVGT